MPGTFLFKVINDYAHRSRNLVNLKNVITLLFWWSYHKAIETVILYYLVQLWRFHHIIQNEHKWCLHIRNSIMKQLGKIIHPNFHIRIILQLTKYWIKACTFSCNDLPPEAVPSRKWRHLCKKKRSVSCCLITPNVVTWVQRHSRTESRMGPDPSTYAFYKHFCGMRCFCGVPFAAKCMDGTGVPTWCVQSYQYWTLQTPLNGKTNFDTCGLVSQFSDVASCITASKQISSKDNLCSSCIQWALSRQRRPTETFNIFCCHVLRSEGR
jgi:hypothetical protein